MRSVAGYHILLLRSRRQANVPDPRETVVSMHRLALAYPPNVTRAQVEELVDTAADVTSAVAGCAGLEQLAQDLGAPPTDAGTGRIGELPPELGALLTDLPVDQPSEPIRMSDGVAVFMVCDRQEASATDRDQISNSIGEERMEMLQRRYLRDLRAAAFIEIRI